MGCTWPAEVPPSCYASALMTQPHYTIFALLAVLREAFEDALSLREGAFEPPAPHTASHGPIFGVCVFGVCATAPSGENPILRFDDELQPSPYAND
jgi:hypothetical protein